MSFNASQGSNSSVPGENEDSEVLSAGVIWVIIFLGTLIFFLSMKIFICCAEFKKYKRRVPFVPGQGNYPKQPPPDIPPPRTDQPTEGQYPKQEYLSHDDPAAQEYTQNLHANLDLSQLSPGREPTNQKVSTIYNNPNSYDTVSSGGDIVFENNFITKPAKLVASHDTTAVSISENCSISLPTPSKKKSELLPIESRDVQHRGGDSTDGPPHITTVNVSFSEPLPTISGQTTMPEVSKFDSFEGNVGVV